MEKYLIYLELEKTDVDMKLVYSLSDYLEKNPEHVNQVQTLTLNDAKPKMGLKGTYGLFGSDEWWQNIQNGFMPVKYIDGIIQNVYEAGQDKVEINNTLDLLLTDGTCCTVGIYVNDEKDFDLFRVHSKVMLIYAFDELKKQPASDSGVNYSKIAIEMAVSKF